jgi:elongation of very long chain fatty acids protein 6
MLEATLGGFIPDSSMKYFSDNWKIPLFSVNVYVFLVFYGPKLMKNAKPFGLQRELALWNLLLAVFSILGAYYTVPELYHNLQTQTFYDTVCQNSTRTWGAGTTGFWMMLFCASKIPELIDTLFIVLRKKPLIFLHWYHHVTVLLYAWDAYSTMASSGLYFAAMNYTVHAIMYSYYFLQAAKMCPKWFPAVLITVLQILQMVVGTVVCMSNWYYSLIGAPCSITQTSMIAGALMYASYLALFVQFAKKRYFTAKKKVQ